MIVQTVKLLIAIEDNPDRYHVVGTKLGSYCDEYVAIKDTLCGKMLFVPAELWDGPEPPDVNV